MRPGALAVLAVLLAASACVPKKNKPPPMKLVALGERRGCGQLVSGAAACWGGSNAHGQIGDGTTGGERRHPTTVAGELGELRAFAIGTDHTCALARTGALHCWGANAEGQLGVATGAPEAPLPVRVPGEWDAVVAGRAHGCARGASGVRCWGSAAATGALGGAAGPAGFAPPALADKRVVALAAAEDATCFAIEIDAARHEVRCFGGTFGAGTRVIEAAPIAALAMNRDHACAVLQNGELVCASAPTIARRRLAPEVAARVDLPEAAVEVGLGLDHACVRTRSGKVACWGANDHHQLADGTTTPSDRAKLIYGLLGVSNLAVSAEGACALVDRGEVRCWGGNAEGELGDGTTTTHDVPMPVRAAPRAN